MRKTLTNVIRLIRPHQWLKNLLILFPPFFAGRIVHGDVLSVIAPALISFSVAASAMYIVNDVLDRDVDKHHPVKCRRVIARGDISVPAALTLAIAMCMAAILFSATVSRRFEGYLILYIILTFLYSLYFKRVIIVEMFFVASGFLLRVLAGGEAFHLYISRWLFLTVFLVALLLTAGKRLSELITLSERAGNHRVSLAGYSLSYLEGILWCSAAATFVTYALYTIEHQGVLFYTVPVATYGLFRYIYIVKQGRGDPTEALLLDGQVLAVGLLWVTMIGMIIYG